MTREEEFAEWLKSENVQPFRVQGGIGRTTVVIKDLDKRDEDKTTSNALILGNSGQGKSYLLKLLQLRYIVLYAIV